MYLKDIVYILPSYLNKSINVYDSLNTCKAHTNETYSMNTQFIF